MATATAERADTPKLESCALKGQAAPAVSDVGYLSIAARLLPRVLMRFLPRLDRPSSRPLPHVRRECEYGPYTGGGPRLC